MQAKESEIEEKVKEIDALRDSSFDYSADAEADATIDAQIERTVIESLTRNEAGSTDVPSDNIAKDTEPAEEIATEQEEKTMIEEETKIETTQPESTELAEAVAAEVTEKDAEAFVEAVEDISVAQVTSKSRGIDITDQLVKTEKEDQVVADDGEEVEEATAEPEASITKPKRRRKIRIIRRVRVNIHFAISCYLCMFV